MTTATRIAKQCSGLMRFIPSDQRQASAGIIRAG
jgi:hypothetical protein